MIANRNSVCSNIHANITLQQAYSVVQAFEVTNQTNTRKPNARYGIRQQQQQQTFNRTTKKREGLGVEHRIVSTKQQHGSCNGYCKCIYVLETECTERLGIERNKQYDRMRQKIQTTVISFLCMFQISKHSISLNRITVSLARCLHGVQSPRTS